MDTQHILIGVTGGVAAYKALDVVSALRKRDCRVQVAMTPAAQRFVSPLTFAAVSGTEVIDQMFPRDPADVESTYPHLYPATTCDAFVVVPATANTIGNLAHGLAPDVVSTSALSLRAECRRVFCPAMNVEMWEQEVVRTNVARLESQGWERVGPDCGHLACGMTGGPGGWPIPRASWSIC